MVEPQNAELRANLALYGLPDDAVQHDSLETSGDIPCVIGGDPATDFCTTHTISTDDVHQMKLWLGNSDADFDSKNLTMAALPQSLTQAPDDTDHIPTLVEAAKHYVYGHSPAVSRFAAAINQHLGPFTVDVLTANNITIKPGSPLVYQGGPKIVVAGTLTFDGPTAQLFSYAHLKMTVNNVVMNA